MAFKATMDASSCGYPKQHVYIHLIFKIETM